MTDKQKLRQEFEAFLNTGLAEKNAADAGKLYAAPAASVAPTRLAASATTFSAPSWTTPTFAPPMPRSNFPPLWYTSWFAWVQYNASIQQPMVRNIGEALGVRARVNLTDPAKLYQSTVNMKSQWEMESLLAGPTAFNGSEVASVAGSGIRPNRPGQGPERRGALQATVSALPSSSAEFA